MTNSTSKAIKEYCNTYVWVLVFVWTCIYCTQYSLLTFLYPFLSFITCVNSGIQYGIFIHAQNMYWLYLTTFLLSSLYIFTFSKVNSNPNEFLVSKCLTYDFKLACKVWGSTCVFVCLCTCTLNACIHAHLDIFVHSFRQVRVDMWATRGRWLTLSIFHNTPCTLLF